MTLNYKEAIKDCITAINNDKQSILGYIRLATCYLQLNEPNQAIIYIKKGLSSCILNEKLEELKKMVIYFYIFIYYIISFVFISFYLFMYK